MSCHVRGGSCFRRSFSISRKQSFMFPLYLLSKPTIVLRLTFKFRPKLITFSTNMDDKAFKICGKSLSDSSVCCKGCDEGGGVGLELAVDCCSGC